jgi:peptidoglycan/xylan/chitin deacetylase (PgdA/CDA1 family)
MDRGALRRPALPLKRLLGLPLAAAVGFLLRQTGRRAGLVLLYHRVGDPQGDPAHELVPRLGTRLFEAQLRHLRAHYEVVSPSQILQATLARRRGGRFPVAVTLDDDLPSHVAVTMPILQRLGLPAAFFLCGASLDAPFAFWWERLQTAVDRDTLAREELPGLSASRGASIHQLATAIEGLARDERDAVAAALESRLGPDPDDAGIRAADVRTLAGGGFELGFHTLRHEPLPSLDGEDLARALTDGRAELAELAGGDVTLIAYPYGYADERVAGKAREAGYSLGFTCRREPVTASTEPLLVGRLEPSFASLGDFALHVVRALGKRSHR